MNRGTKKEVAQVLSRLVSIFSAGGGGYVVACSHELQSDGKLIESRGDGGGAASMNE